jgi:hypothetical protein
MRERPLDQQLVTEVKGRKLADDEPAAKAALAQGSAPGSSEVY